MRALQITEPRAVHVIETPARDPMPDEVLIRVSACGICGTDVHIAAGTYMGSYPIIPGHEFSGVVEAVGSEVRRIVPGAQVAVEPNLPCNNCEACLRNQQNHCLNWRAIGVTLPGAMAEYVCAPESAVFDVGELEPDLAALMEPLSCVLHGLDKVTISPGDSAVVIGAGPIGLLLSSVLALKGARQITLAERNTARLERASTYLDLIESVQIDLIEDASSLPTSAFDLAVDATGAPAAIAETLRVVRSGGECLWFGVSPRDAQLTVEPFTIFQKGLSIHGAFTSLRNSQEAVRVLQSGVIPAEALITRIVDLAEVDALLAELHRGSTSELKCIVRP